MTEDIAERLERHSRDDHGGRGLLHDAAEEIKRLREEIERLREELNVESVRPAAADLLATWDANEWAERADGGELAESIKALREAAEAARDD